MIKLIDKINNLGIDLIVSDIIQDRFDSVTIYIEFPFKKIQKKITSFFDQICHCTRGS
jgi:hypothetical protein